MQVERCLYAAQLATKPAAGSGGKQVKAAADVADKGASSKITAAGSSKKTPPSAEQSGKPAKKQKAEAHV